MDSVTPSDELILSDEKYLFQKQDLVAAGGGIAGLMTAYLYKRRFPDHNVLVLERHGQGRRGEFGGIGRGQSGRSGGHRLPGFEADHSQVENLIGESAALRLYQETINASKLTDQIIAEEKIACGARHGYWILDGKDKKFPGIDHFLAPRRALGLLEPEFYEDAALKQRVDLNGYEAGLYFPDIASFDTPKFLYGLAEAFVKRGGRIIEGCAYTGHNRIADSEKKTAFTGRYLVKTSNMPSLQTDHLMLAGGDHLSRKIPFLHDLTASIYTGRIGVKLGKSDFKRISPQAVALSGCDINLRSNEQLLKGDVLWFSLREDGFLVMGFGGCIPALTREGNEGKINEMMAKVGAELFEHVPFLKNGKHHIKIAVGGMNTSSNLLPIIGQLDNQDGVYVMAAQSGVGLNQSVMLAKAWVDAVAGDTTVYDLLTRLQEDQISIPTHPFLRSAALQMGSNSTIRWAVKTAKNLLDTLSLSK